MEDAQLEALRQEFEANRARIWQDPSIPFGSKGPAVERLWAEYDRRRNELRQAMTRGEVPAGTSRRLSFLAGKRRRPLWK
jgi:hypothetical protein